MSASSRDYRDTWNQLASTEESALLHVAGYTDEERISFEAGRTLGMLRTTIGVHPDDVTLEIGCGVGRVGQVLAPLIKRWIGCDVSDNMLKFAAQRLAGLPNVEFVAISGTDLQPIPDASVDAVYCTVVFMHLEEWDRFAYVREAFRVLKPGGRFHCDNANLDTDEGWEVFLASAAFPPGHRPVHLSRCSTLQELAVYLRRAGFREVQTGVSGVWAKAWGVK
jgi:ubiquinone/menaquinone biosynthesis C-methylase UbiE